MSKRYKTYLRVLSGLTYFPSATANVLDLAAMAMARRDVATGVLRPRIEFDEELRRLTQRVNLTLTVTGFTSGIDGVRAYRQIAEAASVSRDLRASKDFVDAVLSGTPKTLRFKSASAMQSAAALLRAAGATVR